jgi:hypothetical protein
MCFQGNRRLRRGLDRRLIERLLSRQVVAAWLALEPYIVEERKRRLAAASGFRYFEDLAARSAPAWLSVRDPDTHLRNLYFDAALRARLADGPEQRVGGAKRAALEPRTRRWPGHRLPEIRLHGIIHRHES